MDRDPKPSFTKKAKGVGLAFLGALSLGGFAGDAGAQTQGRPLSPAERSTREYQRFSASNQAAARRSQEAISRMARRQAVYCEQLRQQVERDGYTATQRRVGGSSFASCNIRQ